MSIEALFFVNWIFWAALSAGTMLLVGITERLGGTTRGYRLFMAWLLVAFAAVLVVSELNLPAGVEASGTSELRRPLTFGFVAGTLVYLVASLARWPRSGIAIGSGLIGLAALVTLAAAGGSSNAMLFAGQLVLAALALGSVNAAMLLGHWYLVTPKLSPAPLRRLMVILVVTLVLQGIGFTIAFAIDGAELEGGIAVLTWLRLGVGILLPIVATILALLASNAASLQASTGLLYIGLALVMAGSIAGASLTYLTGVPV
ncbi:MAG TPA: hypothetical protein VFW95_04035 [Candidatus Limnocylindria bacterium]|nr:hypothetical protein [Candidatus Limnocylindria bacterium]